MTLTLKSLTGLAAATGMALLAGAASAQMTITKYGPGTDTGSSITFTGKALATFTEADGFFKTTQDTIADFNSGTNFSGNAFSLEIKGGFTLNKAGSYTFTQASDDGSYSFLTGPGYSNTPLISVQGPTVLSSGNGPKTLNLGAGTYSYEVQYSESNGAPGTLRFNGVPAAPAAVPEPSSVASMGLGGVGLLGLLLRARKAKRAV